MSASKVKRAYPGINVCVDCDDKNESVLECRINYVISRVTETRKNCCMFCRKSFIDDNDDDNLRNSISEPSKGRIANNLENALRSNNKVLWIGLFICLFVVSGIFYFYNRKTEYNKFNVTKELENLKLKYSKESKELWQNVRKIIGDSERPHSFVLLYKRNGSDAAECFAKDLMRIINKMHNKNDLVVYENKNSFVEYGEELNEYLKIVKESKHMIVPKLQEIHGDTARMFHTICDFGEHSIKPSYIIFTLEDKNSSIYLGLKGKTPYERAGKILRKTWDNLAENELHPLISRIVRNVAEVAEVNVSC